MMWFGVQPEHCWLCVFGTGNASFWILNFLNTSVGVCLLLVNILEACVCFSCFFFFKSVEMLSHVEYFSLRLLLVLKLTFCLSPQSTEQVTAFCHNLHEMNPTEGPVSCSSSSSTSSFSSSPISPLPVLFTPRQLSDADKLRKVISELVDTERTYVKVSICCAFKAMF